MYAQVVVNQPVEGTFHYHIPAELAGRIRVGHLVEVSFGPHKNQAVVLSIDERSPVDSTKPVLGLVDREPVLTQQQLALASWISSRYWAPLSECIRLFIPPGLARRGDTLVTPLLDLSAVEADKDTEKRLIRLLALRGPLRGRQIARALPRRDWQSAARTLADRGIVAREPVLDPPDVSAKRVRVAELAFPPQRIDAIIDAHFANSTPRQQRSMQRRADILRLLAESRGALEVGQIYVGVAGSGLADLKSLAEDDWLILRENEVWRDPLRGLTFIPDTPPTLTSHQQAAWQAIQQEMVNSEPAPILLHGVTGSGKTELYLRAVDAVLQQGQSALIMVPEIALTPQTLNRIGARFRGRLGLIHSRLSSGERYDTWRRARLGQFDVIVGPRSALFAPLANLGLIVIDECHDDSYKQSPPFTAPYYHALPTAIELARRHHATVILGSATPDVGTYWQALSGGEPAIRLVSLPARIMGHRRAIEQQTVHYHLSETRYAHDALDPDEAVMIDLPPVKIVDMRQELRADNRSIFSRALDQALHEVLRRDEQAILFLNRRGTATYVFCRACGYVLHCPRCDTPLTWHISTQDAAKNKGALVCHQCNYRGQQPDVCPSCGSKQIRYFGGGTERVEQEVRERFPDARIVRWDRDTTQGKDSHMRLLEQFASRQFNVLVGTQMITKGLDLPMVTLVGVINADTGLHLPDFRNGERTFQLLTQVAGRAGRGVLGGEVIIQTYSPEHYAIQAAAQHDFQAFYAREITLRRDIGYPPFSHLVRLIMRGEKLERVRAEAERIHGLLSARRQDMNLNTLTLIGPAPCFYARQDGVYRWQVIIRGPDPTAVLEGIHAGQSLQIDVDPVSLL
jgi:primosomal protein N' (replication factor Y) (superfamily II helicase)